MAKLRTTLGQLAVNELLPASLRDYTRQLDRKSLDKVLSQLATESPEKYREISHRLSLLGIRVAEQTGGFTFGPRHLRMAESAKANRVLLKKELDTLLDDDALDANQRNTAVIALARKYQAGEPAKVYQESLAEKNPLALQILSGSRGNLSNLASLRASSLLFADAKDEPVPIAVMRSYSQGLSPSEYWAATYGGRRSVMTTKLGIADSGYMGKQLVRVAHRLLVTANDSDQEPDASSPIRGLPTDTDDVDNEGSLLAQAVGGFARNTILTPKILTQLQKKGVKRILVRSPMVGGPDDGGVYARDVGIREFGRLPTLHEPVGISAAQSVGERLSQVALSSKHSGGVAGGNKLLSGMPLFKALINTPKVVKGGAAHSTVDGKVERIEPGPAGGQYVWIAGKRHFVGQGLDPHVKPGDTVEAGDVLSEGIPNPAAIVEHKGIGEGRRYFTKLFGDSLRGAGIGTHRRNIELLARGLINHVELLDEIGEGVPGDVMPYQALESTWQPRPGAKLLPLKQAVGKYLERPVLHYSIGTPLRPSVMRELAEFGVQNVDAHDDPPPFKSTMIRADTMLQYDPDFMTRMYGSHLRKSFLGAVHRGGSSDAAGTSFVPGLAKGVDFGLYGKVQTPKTAPPLQGWASGEPLQTEVADYKPPAPVFKQAETYSHIMSNETGTYDILALIELLKDQPAVDIPLGDLKINRSRATGFSPRRYAAADTQYPLLVAQNGALLDGRHRAAKLKDEGAETASVRHATPQHLAAVKQAAALTLAFTIDRPQGTKKTFHTPDGDKEVTYPVDYGFFDDIFNPDDMEEADIFVGTGELCGRFMKGDNLSGEWKPDERKWYVNLTDDELDAVKDMYRGDADTPGEMPSLLRDWVRFESTEELQRDVQLLPQRDLTKEANLAQLLPILIMLGSAGIANLPALLQFFGLKGLLNGSGASKPNASGATADATSKPEANTYVATPEQIQEQGGVPGKTMGELIGQNAGGAKDVALGLGGAVLGQVGRVGTAVPATVGSATQYLGDSLDWARGIKHRAPGGYGAAAAPLANAMQQPSKQYGQYTNSSLNRAMGGLANSGVLDVATGVGNVASGVAAVPAGVMGSALTLPTAMAMRAGQNAADFGDWMRGTKYRAPGSAGATMQPWADTFRGANQNALDFTGKAWTQAMHGLSGDRARTADGRQVRTQDGRVVYTPPSTALNDHVATQVAEMRDRAGITGSTLDKAIPGLTEAALGTGQSAAASALFAGPAAVARYAGLGRAAAPYIGQGAARGIGSTYNYMMTSPTGAVLSNFSPSGHVLGNVPGLRGLLSPEATQRAGDYYRNKGEQYGGWGRYLGHGMGTVRELAPTFVMDNLLFRGGFRGVRALAPKSTARTLGSVGFRDAANYTKPTVGIAATQGAFGALGAAASPPNTQAYAPQNNNTLPLSTPTMRTMPPTSPPAAGPPKPTSPAPAAGGASPIDNARANVPGF